MEAIRNIAIIAHVDHGKTTLVDKIMYHCQLFRDNENTGDLILDNNDLERERGITITSKNVSVVYKGTKINIIDTPGHVDFTYEVSRSLAACEGAILIIDSTQGVEAQTIANVYLAIENNLEIVPVVNKIDLPSADPERVKQEAEDIIGIDTSEAILTSAKENR